MESLYPSMVAFCQLYQRMGKAQDESNAGLLTETTETQDWLIMAMVRKLKQIRWSLVGKYALLLLYGFAYICFIIKYI